MYYALAGTKTTATVITSRNANNSSDDTYYIFKDQTGTPQNGSDRVFGLEAPRNGEVINIYYLNDGRSTYVTPIDDIVLPLGMLLLGGLALKGTFMMRKRA